MSKTVTHRMEIKPAITPKDRHKIQEKLKEMGYRVIGGGTYIDERSCDVTFEKEQEK